MSDKDAIFHTALSMEETSEPDATSISTLPKRKSSQARPLRDRLTYRSIPNMSYAVNRGSEAQIQGSFLARAITNRERAEIQLEAILNDPEVSLPFTSRNINDPASENDLSVSKVSKLLNSQPLIVERLVNLIYPSNNLETTKSLNRTQLLKLTRVLTSTIDVRALLFFMMLDENDNNYITRDGLQQFYEQYLKELRTFDDTRLKEVIPVLLEKFHLDRKSKIDYEEFFQIVSHDSSLLESLSQFTVQPEWFVQSTTPPNGKRSRIQRILSSLCWQQKIYESQGNKLTISYIRDNLSRISFITFYLLVNLVLSLYVIIYRATVVKSNVFVIFARTGGMLLNFNCSFIVVLMLRRTILIIRTNRILRKLIPVDEHIDFHRVVGRVIACLSVVHIIGHMSNFGTMTEYSWPEYMFTTKPNIGWIGGFAPISGIILTAILIVIVICSMKWVRRGGHFEVFYWTHLLYIPYFVFLIVHARNFWKWGIGPLSVLFCEKIYSIITRYSVRSGRTFIHSAKIEQSNVIKLTIHRPKHFTFKPGDYVTINLPHIALYEFHPFTISSAPENQKYITVHIQAVGNWTKQVYQHFKDLSINNGKDNCIKVYYADSALAPVNAGMTDNDDSHDVKSSDTESESDQTESSRSHSKTKIIKGEPIIVNGPYSSCARYVFDCKHVVLVGGGIGITPYASILSSLMEQFRASRIICNQCHRISYHKKALIENRRLKKVDFIWVNRDQKNFEWFLNLLQQFEDEQEHYLKSNSNEKRFLDIHLYFTEIKHEENIGNAPLDLITKVWSQVAGNDIFTSLKSKTHIGRPKWDEVFHQLISGENVSTANDVNVFFCGPSTMGTVVKKNCAKYKFRYYEEKF